MAWEGRLAFRPASPVRGVEFAFSEHTIDCAALPAKWDEFVCRGTKEAAAEHTYAVQVIATPTESGEGCETVLRIHAPLVVVNALPYDVDFQVWVLKENKSLPLLKTCEGSVRSGQHTELHQRFEADRLGLCVRMQQYQFSAVVPVVGESIHFQLPCAEAGIAPLVLHAQIEYVMNRHRSC